MTKLNSYSLLLCALLAVISAASHAADLSKAYLTEKFSNKTVKGFHNKKEFAFTRYYYPDGTLIGRSEKKGDRTGTWRVETNTLCEKFGAEERCRRVEEKQGVIYRLNKKASKKNVTYGTFTDGNDLLDHKHLRQQANK